MESSDDARIERKRRRELDDYNYRQEVIIGREFEMLRSLLSAFL